MFDRRVIRKFFNASSDKAVVEITSLPCPQHTHIAMRTLLELMATLAGNPDMLHCDGRFAEAMEIRHDGQKWIIKAEAIVPRTTFK